MKEGKRQKQVGSLINKEINDILQRLGLAMIDGGMVSVSAVRITPDLLEARIYLSFFKVENPTAALKRIEDRAWEIKKELASRIKLQLRRVPEIKYFADDTLDHVFRMEELFKQIKKEDSGDESGTQAS